MPRERDLFRAIVLSGIAVVGGASCGSDPDPVMDGAVADAGRTDGGGGVRDSGGETDSGSPGEDSGPPIEDAGEDGMVLIL